ncbi:MAG: ketopantoate reductase family protein, partial [Brooklawnia sp.]
AGPHSPADLVIFAVKDRHLDDAISQAEAVIAPHTLIISVMNGLDSEERIAERFSTGQVLLCVALGMDAERNGPEISFRQPGRLLVGESRNDPSSPGPAVRRVQQALDRAGLTWQTPADMDYQIWWKFMVNVGINQASALLRAPYGAFQPDGDARQLMFALMDEVVSVAQPAGVDLGTDGRQAWSRVLATMPEQGWTSMAQDVLAGRATEVEAFAGRVVALGARYGIPTPYNQAALWILRAQEPTG